MKKKNFTFKTFILITILFFVAQLIVNSNLSPLGTRLQELNSEKEYLVESDENISEELAKLDSIIVVKELAQKKLNFGKHDGQSILYIKQESVLAEK